MTVVHARDIVGGDLAVERARELGYKVVFEPTGSEPTASASGAAAAVVFDAAALEHCERGAHLHIARTRAHRNHLARKGLTERTSLADKGIIVVTAKSLIAAKEIIFADAAVLNKLFVADVQKLNVFYESCLERPK